MNKHQVFPPAAPALPTLIDLLQLRARDQPDRIGYTFLLDGEQSEAALTYAELDRRARAIAVLLLGSAAPGDRALLLYPPGLDYLAAFFGCLYAGVIAVPAYPPHPNRPMPRLQTIVADAEARHVLTTSALLAQIQQRFAQLPDLARLRWLATDVDLDALAGDWHAPPITSESLAMLQYTSGSTAAPKGVMLSHANLLHNQRLIQQGFGHTAQARIVGWLPLYHDMGLIGNVLQPLYLGAACVLMSPVAFLQRPVRWLQAISRYQATTSGAPNFAYDLCTRKIMPQQRDQLDLSSWNLAFCGAEPVRAATLTRFAELFAPCGFRREAFYPCYGLAEATLIVSGGSKAELPVVRSVAAAALEQGQVLEGRADDQWRELVSCGKPLGDLRVAIVQPDSLVGCGPGAIGEIWVAGPSVAQGYWNQPDTTTRTFRAQLAGDGSKPFLRTGDLGFVEDGELFVTGRLKDLIIIRGRNHYPQDIELTVEESDPLLRPGGGAAFSVDIGDDERLVIVQEVERQGRHLDLSAAIAAIRRRVAEEHELQAHAVVLIKPATIPKTSSGKTQRHACRAAFLSGDLALVAAWTADSQPAPGVKAAEPELPAIDPHADLEPWLQATIARVCGLAAQDLAVDQPITRYGLDSMAAIEIQHRIESETGAPLSVAALLHGPTIAELAAEITALRTNVAQPGDAVGAESNALAYGQRALWFLHQLAPESSAYTIANAVQIQTALDLAALRQAAQLLVDRHPSLRTVFPALHGEPIRQVLAQQPIAFVYEDATAWDAAQVQDRLANAAHQPFDLEAGPLLRMVLLSQSPDRHVLLLAMHHIITDFWSQALLLQELDALYTALIEHRSPVLPPLAATYDDYVQWQQSLLAGAEGAKLWAYWRQHLGDAPTILDLPTDRPRPPVQSYHGAAYTFTIDRELTVAIKAFSQAQSVTLYIILLSAFQVLLHRYTSQHDLLVGSPLAGRSRARFAPIAGYFVNPVALRANFAEAPSVAALLKQTQQTVLAAFEHQEYPFPLLVERLQPERDPSRPPLVQAMFALQQAPPHAPEDLAALALGIDGVEVTLEALRLQSLALPQQAAQFEIALVLAEVAGSLRGSWEYNSDLFEADTIARMATHWQELLRSFIADPGQSIAILPLLTDAERQRLLIDWNATAMEFPGDRTLHALFAEQAARHPNLVAASLGERSITYADLNARANQLAHHLRSLGVGPDVCVGLCVPRSLDALIGILGILKAGGAYLPLDPGYPAERIAWMVETSRISVLVTLETLLHSESVLLPTDPATTVCLDRDWPAIAGLPEANPAVEMTADHLAYVLFTSGSTGRPKGVCCHHAGVVNVLADVQRRQPLSPGMRCSAWTSLSFDVSVLEIFTALLFGATVEFVPDETRLDGAAFMRWLHDRQIQCAYIPPFMVADLAAWVDQQPAPPLQRIVVGVEPIPESLLLRITGAIPDLHILHGYGPTETTIAATLYSFDPGTARDDIAPLGGPIQNMQVYVLDRRLQPVPVGVAGEVYIGGVGVARGYLNRPDLTAERFLPDPFARVPGSRFYRTGDLARHQPDGNLLFVGRTDHQVKLRGFRIELGEIAAALLQHPAVREAVVLVREIAPGDKRLIAYVVEEQGNKETKDQRTKDQSQEPRTQNLGSGDSQIRVLGPDRSPCLGAADLRQHVGARLPDYMIPSAFVPLDALPLTPNGKLDRKALPLPTDLAQQRTTTFVAPQTAIEQTIARIWQEVLQAEQVGADDNFFELGGHSLLMARVHSRIQSELGVDLPLTALFKYPTIARLAQHLGQDQPPTPSFQRSADRAALRKDARRQRRRPPLQPQSSANDDDV